MSYVLTLLAFLGIGTILAMSLNIVMGYTGLVSVAHAGLTGAGAYGASWFALNVGLDMGWSILVGGLVAMLVGLLFAMATMHISGDEFILASFAFQMVIVEAISRWTPVTRGTYGLSGIPRPVILGVVLTDIVAFSAFVLVATVGCAAILLRLGQSPYGLVLRGLRESMPSMQALGRNTVRIKVTAFAIGSLFAGIAGGLTASMVNFIHPSSFDVMLSIIIVAYLLVGGLGNMVGAIIGVVVLMSVPELIALSGVVPTNLIGPLERVLYGMILMGFVWLRPDGLVPERPVLLTHKLIAAGKVSLPPTPSAATPPTTPVTAGVSDA